MKYYCTYENCKASFPRPSKLKIHIMKIHLKESLFVCSYQDCGKDYTQAAHLKRHIEISHEGKKNLLYSFFQCGIVGCDKKFETKHGLVRHHQLHTQEKEFKCSHCSESFRLNRLLEKHMVTHTGKARFECETCSLNFNDYNLFYKHRKQSHTVHRCERAGCENLQFSNYKELRKHESSVHPIKFSCAECDKQFTRRLHLVEHITSEHECLTFSCNYEGCDRVFSYKRNLASHVRSHHKKIRFSCEVCGQELCTKQKLQEHIVKIHLTPPNPKKQARKSTKSLAARILGLSYADNKLLKEESNRLQQEMSENLPVKS